MMSCYPYYETSGNPCFRCGHKMDCAKCREAQKSCGVIEPARDPTEFQSVVAMALALLVQWCWEERAARPAPVTNDSKPPEIYCNRCEGRSFFTPTCTSWLCKLWSFPALPECFDISSRASVPLYSSKISYQSVIRRRSQHDWELEGTDYNKEHRFLGSARYSTGRRKQNDDLPLCQPASEVNC